MDSFIIIFCNYYAVIAYVGGVRHPGAARLDTRGGQNGHPRAAQLDIRGGGIGH